MVARGKTIKAFEADLKGFADALGVNFGDATRKVVFDLHKTVTNISPVRTGRFRASWGISPFEIPGDTGEPPSVTGTPNSIPISAQRNRINVDRRQDFTIWYVYNNLPYAQPLEDGSSDQAPHGILDLALATVEAEIDAAYDDLFGGR